MDRAHNHLLRRGRFSQPGELYLLTTVTYQRQRIFTQMRFARAVIHQLRKTDSDGLTQSLAWVVMPDHVHWLIELQTGTLCHLMRRFKSCSSHALYQAGMARRKIWQAGYYDRALRRKEHVQEVARYIIANPIRAGLVTRSGDYPHWDAIWV
ncbi:MULTISPECIES: REP-associated tyrosine transposase [Pseudomonas]|jgi:REP element-mobilizing transposase RayT|uniref:REP-associated tyrosine transposase n=1 Tax=Pseudomonas TaxID=286 RepID=UPI000CD3E389|nr:transposase [Pseudomonas putida]